MTGTPRHVESHERDVGTIAGLSRRESDREDCRWYLGCLDRAARTPARVRRGRGWQPAERVCDPRCERYEP